jgi:hypothetical protein
MGGGRPHMFRRDVVTDLVTTAVAVIATQCA